MLSARPRQATCPCACAVTLLAESVVVFLIIFRDGSETSPLLSGVHKDDGCVQGETIVEEATTNEVKKAERDFQTIRVPGSGAAVRAIIVLSLYNAMLDFRNLWFTIKKFLG